MGKLFRILLIGVMALLALSLVLSVVSVFSGTPVIGTALAQEDHDEDSGIGMGLKLIGAGVAVGLAGIGAGIGEASVGAAAVGAMAEDPKMFGKGLLMTVIPETIVIFGLLIAFMIMGS